MNSTYMKCPSFKNLRSCKRCGSMLLRAKGTAEKFGVTLNALNTIDRVNTLVRLVENLIGW